jgi:hypothetical protein
MCTNGANCKSQSSQCTWQSTLRLHKPILHTHSHPVQCSVSIAFSTAQCTVPHSVTHRLPRNSSVLCSRLLLMFVLPCLQLKAAITGAVQNCSGTDEVSGTENVLGTGETYPLFWCVSKFKEVHWGLVTLRGVSSVVVTGGGGRGGYGRQRRAIVPRIGFKGQRGYEGMLIPRSESKTEMPLYNSAACVLHNTCVEKAGERTRNTSTPCI